MQSLNPRLFNPSLPLVMARLATLYEHDMAPGDALTIVEEHNPEDGTTKGEIGKDIALRLWLSRQAVYAKDWNPTPIETPEQEAERVVRMEATAGGWYVISAPWLTESIKVQGKAKAQAEHDRVVEKGDTKGVEVTGGDGGWYAVTAPWLDEPEKVQGLDAANTRADALTAEGPPEGWVLLTPEEKAAQAEQAAALDEARRIAQEQADADAEKDRIALAEQAERDRVAAEAAAAAGGGNPPPVVPDPPADPDAEVRQSNFVLTANEDETFTITGTGIDEPLVFQTKDEADARFAELDAEHPFEKAAGEA